jgi:alpha-1,3/alpha-1,6-mannosyltransferase
MKVVFLHPDLGVGGAERLILDTALAVKSNGHDVTILTNHYDPKHCFEDSKEFNIVVKFDSVPRQICGYFHALLAYFKLFLAALWLIYFSSIEYDLAIVDQISIPVALFKINKKKCLFYCHFPDQLLCVYDKRRSPLKRLYRAPLNWLEMTTTGMADVVLVNSNFTAQIFRETFKSLADKRIDVLYPSLNTEAFDNLIEQFSSNLNEEEKDAKDPELARENKAELEKLTAKKKFIFLSINRYERKKDLKLAIEAMSDLKAKLTGENWESCHLIMAGGFDWRVSENVQYYAELRLLANEKGLDGSVSFLRSISDRQKIQLLRRSCCLLYTPTNEHFGIVPVEAMYCEKPVIATNTGGPLETVANEETGYLVEANADAFASRMAHLIKNPKLLADMCREARKRVIDKFSFIAFKQRLNKIMLTIISNKEKVNSGKKSQ